MPTTVRRTPGVYTAEENDFPGSGKPVATAVPAFIGYTPQAEYKGKCYTNKATKISSMAEFQTIFMLPDPPAPADPAKQYNPEYYLVAEKSQPDKGDYMTIEGAYYSILPDPSTIYYLYNSIRLFYQNGGGDAYIVSVGGYGPAAKQPLACGGEQIVNPNVTLNDLLAGVALLANEQEPTMYICPEATLLCVAGNGTLMETMLHQAENMQTPMCIFDIIGGRDPDPILYTQDIQTFRDNTGSQGLKYGASYYPFVDTTIMQSENIDYTNLFGGDVTQLAALLNPPSCPNSAAEQVLNMIENPSASPLTVSQYNAALADASATYAQMMKHVLQQTNVLPPSGGMAGVYTTTDKNLGVWHAPANVSIVGVADLPIKLSTSQQDDLNSDPVSGKSINAIRFFNGQGILVWGAKTLDGNSHDWRYIPVCRTVTMLGQMCKLATSAYEFKPNDANTWAEVNSMISSFLTTIWKEGGLQGATAAHAFQVEVGLGSTMTSEDILNEIMNVSVKVALVRPAEFIVINFAQEMTQS